MKLGDILGVIQDGLAYAYILEAVTVTEKGYTKEEGNDEELFDLLHTQELYKFITSDWVREINTHLEKEVISMYHSTRDLWEKNYKDYMMEGSEIEGTVTGYFIIVK